MEKLHPQKIHLIYILSSIFKSLTETMLSDKYIWFKNHRIHATQSIGFNFGLQTLWHRRN